MDRDDADLSRGEARSTASRVLLRRPASRSEARRVYGENAQLLTEAGIRPGERYWCEKDVPADLSGPGATRHDDPETARAAAVNPNLDFAKSRKRVLGALHALGESRSCDIAAHLGVDRSSVSPRLNEMGPGGSKAVRYDPPLVRKTGRTLPGEGPGVENETWELTERGALEAERFLWSGAE